MHEFFYFIDFFVYLKYTVLLRIVQHIIKKSGVESTTPTYAIHLHFLFCAIRFYESQLRAIFTFLLQF